MWTNNDVKLVRGHLLERSLIDPVRGREFGWLGKLMGEAGSLGKTATKTIHIPPSNQTLTSSRAGFTALVPKKIKMGPHVPKDKKITDAFFEGVNATDFRIKPGSRKGSSVVSNTPLSVPAKSSSKIKSLTSRIKARLQGTTPLSVPVKPTPAPAKQSIFSSFLGNIKQGAQKVGKAPGRIAEAAGTALGRVKSGISEVGRRFKRGLQSITPTRGKTQVVTKGEVKPVPGQSGRSAPTSGGVAAGADTSIGIKEQPKESWLKRNWGGLAAGGGLIGAGALAHSYLTNKAGGGGYDSGTSSGYSAPSDYGYGGYGSGGGYGGSSGAPVTNVIYPPSQMQAAAPSISRAYTQRKARKKKKYSSYKKG